MQNNLCNWKPKTYRNKGYLQFIRGLSCVVCGTSPCDPHHTETAGKSIKASDLTCVPLCREHHMEIGTIGRETFQARYGINFKDVLIKCMKAYIEKMEPDG